MKYIIISITYLLLITSKSYAQSAEEFIDRIANDAASIQMDPRHFLYSTQVLAQNKLHRKIAARVIPESAFRIFDSNVDHWNLSEVSGEEKTKYEELQTARLKVLVEGLNKDVYAHANALRISLLDLPKFYTLKDIPSYAPLFEPLPFGPAPKEDKITTLTIEVLCQFTEQNCKRQLNRTNPKYVAKFWVDSINNDLNNNALFTVRYVDKSGQQVGNQELWRFHEAFGPRFIEAL